jgi:glycosyltransferase involved in cell wall biosynthesis
LSATHAAGAGLSARPRVLFVTEAPLRRPLPGDCIVTAQLIDALGSAAVLRCLTLRPGQWELGDTPAPAGRPLSDAAPAGAARLLNLALAALRNEPAIRSRFADVDLQRLQAELDGFDPQVVVLDHLRCGWLAGAAVRWGGRPRVYVAHNAESAAYGSTAQFEPNPLLRAFLTRQARAVASLEREVLRSCAAVMTLTPQDAERLRVLAPAVRVAVIPPWTQAAPTPPQSGRDAGTVLLVGSFLWHAKRRNAAWLTGEVWPRVRRMHPQARLEIVGRGADRLATHAGAGSGIALHADVPDVAAYLGRAAVFVNPERQVGGIKLKTLEAAAAGLPIVSTPAGVEGTGLVDGTSCVVCRDAEQFAGAVAGLLGDASRRAALGAAAVAAMRAHLDRPAFRAAVWELLESTAARA